MLKLHELKPYRKSTKRRKVVGRGVGSGHGTYSGRGAKGQKARSGSSIPVGFEGGRMPLQRQMPKLRGFKSRTPKAVVVRLDRVESKFNTGQTVNPKELFNKGLVKSHLDVIKILGDGKLTKALTFEKVRLSKSAVEKIEKAGGKITAQ
ncbi:MAG: 50S ribosomal protein L15 [Candidatus Doudnabacteria bacterium]|nr:50S ribosomal protein L15 [Candidatus Doudnabacteria bacterium]